MEIKITTRQILLVLYIISWVIFIGLCVEAGGVIGNAFYTLAINPVAATWFWEKIDLSPLYQFDPGYFFVTTLLMAIVTVLKALMFYTIVKMLHEKKLDMSQPFSKAVGRFVFNLSYLSLGIGLFSQAGAEYAAWFIKQGVKMPGIEDMHFGGADVWLFMGITLLVVAQIFKRGIEIQTENDLTV